MMLMSEIFDLRGGDPSWAPSGIYLVLFKLLPYLCNEAWTLDYLINLPGLYFHFLKLHCAFRATFIKNLFFVLINYI